MLRVDLDSMVALYDRRAGVTHLLAEPAVLILDALAASATDVDGIVARLQLEDRKAIPLLTERLDELVATGLVERP